MSLTLVAVHGFASLALVFLFAFGATAVPELFAAGQREFTFGHAIAKINFQRNESKAFLLNLAAQFIDLAAVEQKLAGAQRAMIPRTAGAVFGNVAIHEPYFTAFDFGVGVAQSALPFPEGFHFGADEDHAGFETVEKFVIVGGGAILRGNFDRRRVFFFGRGLIRRTHRCV